jgi:threonine synthase
MWKAYADLEALGWLGCWCPKMIAVPAAGGARIVRAFEQGTRRAALWENAHTVAAGIRVPAAIGDFLILDAVRESGGFAIAVDDDAILAARDEVGREEGLLLCPEGAATWAAYKHALADGRIAKADRCVLFNCADARKYPLRDAGTALDRNRSIDYARL